MVKQTYLDILASSFHKGLLCVKAVQCQCKLQFFVQQDEYLNALFLKNNTNVLSMRQPIILTINLPSPVNIPVNCLRYELTAFFFNNLSNLQALSNCTPRFKYISGLNHQSVMNISSLAWKIEYCKFHLNISDARSIFHNSAKIIIIPGIALPVLSHLLQPT